MSWSDYLSEEAPRRSFFFIVGMPTPNGRFHIGHIGGPILKMDAAARLVSSRGHDAHFVMATDIYEAHVPLQAVRDKVEPQDVINRNCILMQMDLQAFGINCSMFVNPLQQPGKAFYERNHLGMVKRLVDAGYAKYVERKMPYSKGLDRFVPRSMVAGGCPNCNESASGGVCEACGAQFSSNDLKDSYLTNLPEGQGISNELQWRTETVLEFAFEPGSPAWQEAFRKIDNCGADAHYLAIAKRHLTECNARCELAIPGTWGIPWPTLSDTQHILYSYSLIHPFALALGEMFAQFSETGRSPFEPECNDISVCSFGTDATVACLAFPIVFSVADPGTRHKRCSPFDHFWGNDFLLLEDDKFSTSRGHVIWGEDLIEKTPIQADTARAYLARIAPNRGQMRFTLGGLLETANEIVARDIHEPVNAALSKLSEAGVSEPHPETHKRLTNVFKKQQASLSAANFDMENQLRLIQSWCSSRHEYDGELYWWLKGLAVLSYPLMPDLGQALWRATGHHNNVDLGDFWRPTPPTSYRFNPQVPVSRTDLNSCLPETLLN